jgi:hypothetical protein
MKKVKNAKKVLAIITATIMILSLTVSISAIQYSDTVKDIEIVYGEFTGYRFHGPDSHVVDEIDTSKIAKVRFYIKCPDLEDIEDSTVLLAYNSGSTSWVETEHDLTDGLIVDVDVEGGVVEGDFFDAALATWSEEVHGTFSVEVVDANGNVLSEPIYGNNVNSVEEPTVPTEPTPTDGTPTDATPSPTDATPTEAPQTSPVATGTTNVITALVMTAISGFAIASMKKKNKK